MPWRISNLCYSLKRIWLASPCNLVSLIWMHAYWVKYPIKMEDLISLWPYLTTYFDYSTFMAGYRAVIVGMDPVCCESTSWMENAQVKKLSRGSAQPFYQVRLPQHEIFIYIVFLFSMRIILILAYTLTF